MIITPKHESYVRKHAFLQSIFFVSIFFSALNVAYTIMVVMVVRSWDLTWWIDRRFPFCLIPMWVFLLVSLGMLVLGIYYYPINRPKLRFDKTNSLLICITMGIITWMILALSLTHTFYIGDFNVLSVLQSAFSGEHSFQINILELSVESIDVFPTLGDTILIGYVLAFLFSFLASWRALRTVKQSRKSIVLGKPDMHWQGS